MSKSYPDHINNVLLGANAAVLSGIFIFFAIASQSVASNLFLIDARIDALLVLTFLLNREK